MLTATHNQQTPTLLDIRQKVWHLYSWKCT